MRLQGKKRLCILLAVLNMCVATGAVDFDDEELGHWDRLGQSVASRVGRVISKPTKVLTRATSASTDFIRRASERIIKPHHTKDPSAHAKDSSPTDTTPTTKEYPHDGDSTAPSSAGEKLTHTIGEAVTHAQDAIKEYTHALPHAHTSPSTDTHTRAHTQTTPEAPWPFSSTSSTDQSASSDSESHPLLGTLKSLVSSSSSDTESSPSSSSSSSSSQHTTSSSTSDARATGRSVHHDHKDSQEDGDRGVIEDDTFAYALVHTLPPTLPIIAAALVVVLGFLSALLWPFKKGTLVDGTEDVKDEVVSREVPAHGEGIMADGTHNEHEKGVEKSTDAASAMDAAMYGDKKASADHGNDGVHPGRNDTEDGEGDVHHSAREEPIRAHDKPQQVGDTVDDGEGSPPGATGADNDAHGNHHHHDNKALSEEEERTGATDGHASDHSMTTSTESSSITNSTNGKAAHGQDEDAAHAHTHAHEDHTNTDSHTHTREDTHAHANAPHDVGHPHHGQRRYASTPSPATTAPSDDEEDAHHHHQHHQHDQEHRQGGEHEERGGEEDNGRSKHHHRPIEEGVEPPNHAHGDGYHDHDRHPGPADDWPSLTHEEELSRADSGGEQGSGAAREGVSGGEGGKEGEEGGTGLQVAPLQGYKDYAHAVKATIPSEEDAHGDSDEMSARALSAALLSLS